MSLLDPNDLLEGGADPDLRALTLDAMACVDRERRLAALRAAGPGVLERWLPFAERNLVLPIAARFVMDAFGTDTEGMTEAQAAYDRSGRRMKVMLSALDDIAARLDGAGIPLVALKNAGIARGIFPDPALCPMGDLDVLVEKARFVEAHQLILDAGFELATRGTVESADLEEGLLHGGTEYVREIDGETVWFELQWRPIAGRWIRPDQEPDGAELIARSVPIDGTKVRLLNPVDNMIQVGLHTAKHTYVRAPGLRLHTDVDRLTHYTPPDWDAVATMAESLEITTAIYFSLAMARALLDTPVPHETLARLAPAPWKRRAITKRLRAVDVFEPEEHKFSRPAMIVFAALLYDDPKGLLASVVDAEKGDLKLRHAPRHLLRGARRVFDIVTRYQA